MLWLVPLGAPVLFLLRGIGDYMSVYFPGHVGRRVIKAIRGDLFRQYLRSADALLRPRVRPAPAVAPHVQRRAGGRGGDQVHHLADPRHAHDRRADRIMFYLNWQLALFVLVLAPPLSWLIRRVSRSFRRYSARIQASMGDVTRVGQGSARRSAGHQGVQRAGAEAREFEQVNEHNRQSNMKLIAARAASNPTVQFIASIGLGGILWVALHQIQAGS